MHSPTLTVLWLTWGRHRWGLAGLLIGLVGLCALHRALPTGTVVSEMAVGVLSISLTLVFIYIIYVFSYAELGARVRPSSFPPWLFTLPVPTSRLVLWPMLSGALAIAVAWLAVARYLLQPAGLDVAPIWPAVALAVSLAWVQAMDWSPLGGVTKALAAGVVVTAVWTVLLSEQFHDAALIGVPCLLPLAFLVAVTGVGHARRGGRIVAPGWSSLVARATAWVPRRRRPFASPERALLWWELRRNGILLPLLIGCWLLLLTLSVHRWEKASVLRVIIGDVTYLPCLAVLVGCVLGKPDVWSRPLRLSSFLGIRPVRTGDLVVAKLKMGALSLLATWLLIGACGIFWMTLTDSFSAVNAAWEDWLTYLARQDFQRAVNAGEMVDPDSYMAMSHPTATFRACAFLGLCGGALFGFTWLLLVGNLVASLAGRLWVLGGAFFFYLGGLPNLLVLESGLQHSDPKLYEALMDVLFPWVAAALVVVKLSLAGWALHRGCRGGLLTTTAAVGIVVVWCLVVGAIVPTAHYFILGEGAAWRNVALACVLFCPLIRIAGAPLVLEWNRRR